MSGLTKDLRSYSKAQLINKYGVSLREIYDLSKSELDKLPKIEIMEEIYGLGIMRDEDKFSSGGLSTKKYMNPVKVIDNRKKKK